MGSLGQEGSGCSRSMREQSGSAGAKTETWISLFFKLCRCGSAALSLSCLTWCWAPVVRLKCSGQGGGLDEEGLALTETGSFHDAPQND